MAVDRSYARLGLFLVVSLVVAIATALFFIQRMRSRPVAELVTYTTDNVSGLDVSSPVRFRGLTLGRVSDIRLVDPNGRIIEVDFELFLDRIASLGGSGRQARQLEEQGLLKQLRAQVIGNPVTGEAYLLLNRPANPSAPIELDFTPTKPYVPSEPSPLTAVQDRLPAFLERAEAELRTFDAIINKIPASLDTSNRFFTNVERIFRESELPALSADSRKFFTTTSAQIDQMSSDLNKLIGTDGTLVSFVDDTRATIKAADFPATAKATRDAADQSSLAADDLRRTLPAIRESLEQLRELARMLEAQPESVVFGRKPAKGESK